MAYDQKSYETLAGFQNPIIERQAAEIERLHARYDKLDNANIRLDRDRANLLDEVVKANAECERLRQAMDWSDAQHDKVKGKLEDALDTLKEENERLKAENDKLKGIQIEWVDECGCDTLRAENERLKAANLSIVMSANMLRTENAELNDKLDGLVISTLRDYEENFTLLARVEEYEEEAVELKADYQAAHDDAMAYKARVEELEVKALDKVWAAEKEGDELRTQLSDMHVKYNGAVDYSDLLNNKLANLAQLNGHNKAEADRLKVQCEALQADASITRAERHDLGLTCIELERQLAAANEKLAALQPPAPTIVKQTWQNVYTNEVGLYLSNTQADANKHGSHTPYRIGVFRRDHYSDGTVKATLEQIGETK